MTDILTENQTGVLRVLCDTVVPAIERTEDPDGFWARRATDVGADQGVLLVLSTLPPEQRTALGGLLDILGSQGFVGASQESRGRPNRTRSCAPLVRPIRGASAGSLPLVSGLRIARARWTRQRTSPRRPP